MIVSLFVINQSISALTFTVHNYSSQRVEDVECYWDNGFRQTQEDIGPRSKSGEYDTKGHRLQMVQWTQNGRCYGVDLRNIASNLLLNKVFIILGKAFKGYYLYE